MQKDLLLNLVEKGMSTYEIGREVDKSQTTVRHWLKKHGLKTDPNYLLKNKKEKLCKYCNELKTLDQFYKRRGKDGGSFYCRPCTNKQTYIRTQKTKQLAVQYKGGECVVCGYKKYIGALEFHHLDPTKKDFNISRKKSLVLNEQLKKELDKCALLCSNCHREVHGGAISL